MHIKYGLIFGCLLVTLAVLVTPIGYASDKGHPHGPKAAAQPLPTDGAIQPTAGDRCPVCGMFPAKRPKSAAAIALIDGRTFYFCGNGCLLRTWRHPKARLGGSAPTIARMRARNYFTGEAIDAQTAHWVAGSDVVGPMGPAIVSLSSPAEVAVFKKRHGGRIVFQLNQMTDALFKKILPMKKHGKHKNR